MEHVYAIVELLMEKRPFTYQGGVFTMGSFQKFIVEKSSDEELVLLETGDLQGRTPIRYTFTPTSQYTLKMKSKYAFALEGIDTIYTEAKGIEPIYREGSSNGFKKALMEQLVGSKALAVEYSFVVKNDGTIGNVEIISTTDPKKNKKLIKAVQQTSGDWIPAKLGERAINVKVSDSFSLSAVQTGY